MKLTEKDKDFLEKLKALIASKDLWVEFKPGSPGRMVLKGTYGEKIHQTFHMTRQGVRWRFQRLFGQVYVEAFLTILMIEKTFGSQLRDYALRISKERYTLVQTANQNDFQSADTLVPQSSQERHKDGHHQ